VNGATKDGFTDVLHPRRIHRRSLVLPNKQHIAADRLMADLRSTIGLVPALFWFETRNLFFVAERRERLRVGEALLLLMPPRGLSLEDAGSMGTGWRSNLRHAVR
jgi:hypothetical protein